MHIRPSRLLLSLFLCLWSLPLYADSGLEVDKSVSPEKQAKLDRADNGVPIVEIAPASKGGVSHNVFKEYNVGQEGIIYNNKADQDPGSSSFGSSVLARMPLLVNDRLSGKAARIILTEVSGSNLSHLRGMTEIYGSQAAYILANPNGIQVDGGGFINTNRVTLTTGASYFSTGGSLGGFRVQKGTVRILKGGLAGPPINLGSSPIEILSRAAVISGSVWNGSPEVSGDSSVSIYTGQNTFNYQDKQVTPASMPTGTPPKLAIDASLLGNIQAGKITFISTEEGVGVKAPRLLSHGGDITIQSQGPVSLPQAVESKESVSVQSAGLLSVSGKQLRGGLVHLSGSEVKIAPEALIYAEGNSGSSPSVLVEAASGVTNEGQIGSKQGSVQVQSSSLTNKGKIVSESGSVQLRVTDTLDNEGEIGSRASLLITAGTVKNSGALAGGTGNNKLEAKTLENSGTINSLHNWEIEADQVTNKPDGELSATGHLSVSGNTLSNEGKLVSAQGGLTLDLTDSITNKGTAASIGSQESLLITTKKVTNSGTITGGEIKNTLTADSLTNSGKINSLSGWSVIAKDVNNTGELIGKSDLSIASTDLSNEGKLLSAQGGVTLDVTDSIANEGSEASIGGKESLTITTKKVTNSGTITGGEGKNELKAETLTNSGTINSLAGWSIETEGLVKNTGELSSKSDLSIASTDLSNEGKLLSAQGSVTLDATASITNEGKEASIGGEKSLTITTKQVTNSGTITGGKGKNTLTADSLTNSGKINSLAGWSITTKGLVKNTGELSATGHLSVSANTLSNEGKLVSAQGGVNLDVASSITNEGKEASIGGKKSLTITTKQVTNSGTITGGEIKNTLTADSLTNSGTIDSLGDWRITAEKVTHSGKLSSDKALVMDFDTLENTGDITGGTGKTELVVKGALINPRDKKITSKQALEITVGGQLLNKGTLASHGNLSLLTKQGKLINEGDITGGKGTTTLTAKGDIENHKTIASKNKLVLTTQASLHNHDSLQAKGSLEVTSNYIHNTKGGTIAGGKGTTKLQAHGDIDNYDHITSTDKLVLTSNTGKLYNAGKVGAANALVVNAATIKNKDHKALASGGTMTLNISKKIDNGFKSKIFSQSDLMMQGPSGGYVGVVANNTGEINSMRDITCKALVVENTGKVTFDPDPKISTRVLRETPGDNDYALMREDYIADEDHTTSREAAHIKASGTIQFLVKDRVTNRDGVIYSHNILLNERKLEATEDTPEDDPPNINGAKFENITSVRKIPLPDGKYYENREEYTVREDSGGRVALLAVGHIATFGLATIATVIQKVATDETWLEVERTEHSLLDKYEDGEAVLSAPSAIVGAAEEFKLKTSSVSNQYSTDVKDVTITHSKASRQVLKDATISVIKDAEIPEAGDTHGIFRLNLAPTPISSDEIVPLRSNTLPTDVLIDSAAASNPLPLPASFLIETNIPFNINKFHGSDYFMRKTGLDKVENRHPLRFLGDPFYENRLINQAILKQTNRLFLHDDIATPEEQVKYLIDNAAEVHKDLNLTFGVALSKEQIARLDRDIIWYVKETVKGQEVLVPKLYLSQATVKGLSAPKGSVVRSRKGKVDIKSKGKVVNIGGEISGKTGVAIKAKEVLNEGVGGVAARIASSEGKVSIDAKEKIENMGGKISGAKGLVLKTSKLVLQDQVDKAGTAVRSKAQILSKTDDVDLQIDHFEATGGKIKAGKGIKAQGLKSVNIKPLALKEEKHTTKSKKTSKSGWGWGNKTGERTEVHEENTVNVLTELEAGNQLLLDGKKIVAEGLKTKAKITDITGDEVSLRAARGKRYEKRTKTYTQKAHRLWGLIGDSRTSTRTAWEDNETADGNVHESEVFRVRARGKADTQSITVLGLPTNEGKHTRAKHISIEDSKGDVEDAPMLLKADYQPEKVELQENQHGLFLRWEGKRLVDTEAPEEFFDGTKPPIPPAEEAPEKKKSKWANSFSKSRHDQGRLIGVKLGEQRTAETSQKVEGKKVAPSQFYGEEVIFSAPQGKVKLKATQGHVGKLRFQSAKGIDLQDARYTQKQTDKHTATKHEESIGLKQKAVEIYQVGRDAMETVHQAMKNTLAYQRYQSGELSEEGYLKQAQAYAATLRESAEHGAALTVAAGKAISATKQIGSIAVEALGSAASLGFSLDAQYDLEAAWDKVEQTYDQSLPVNFVADEAIEIETPGDVTSDSAQLISRGRVTLLANNLKGEGSKQSCTVTTNSTRGNVNASAEVDFSGVHGGGSVDTRYQHGKRTQTGHRGMVIVAQEVDVTIEENIEGAVQMRGHVHGKVGGDVKLKDLQNTVEGYTLSGGMNGGCNTRNGFHSSVRGGYSSESGKGLSDQERKVAYEGKQKKEGKEQAGEEEKQELPAFEQSFHAHIDGLKEGSLHVGGKQEHEQAREVSHDTSKVDLQAGFGQMPRNLREVPQAANGQVGLQRKKLRGRTVIDAQGEAHNEITGKHQVAGAVDRRTAEALMDPAGTVKDIKRNTSTVHYAGKGVVQLLAKHHLKKPKKDPSSAGEVTQGPVREPSDNDLTCSNALRGAMDLMLFGTEESQSDRLLTAEQARQQIPASIRNRYNQHHNIQDAERGPIIKDPSTVDADQRRDLADHEINEGNEGQPSEVFLYNMGDADANPIHGTQDPARHNGNFNAATHAVGLNGGRIKNGSDRVATTYTERTRRQMAQSGITERTTRAQQREQAYTEGDLARAHHDDFMRIEGSPTEPARSHQQWLTDNDGALQAGNRRMRAASPRDLRPCLVPLMVSPEEVNKIRDSEINSETDNSIIKDIGSEVAISLFFSELQAPRWLFKIGNSLRRTKMMQWGGCLLKRLGNKALQQGGKQVVAEWAKKGTNLFSFTKTAAAHMDKAGRMIPVQTLDTIIKAPMHVLKDPQGTKALMHYSQMWKNGRLYNVEVLYNKVSNTIMHFKYTQKGIGPLKAIPK